MGSRVPGLGSGLGVWGVGSRGRVWGFGFRVVLPIKAVAPDSKRKKSPLPLYNLVQTWFKLGPPIAQVLPVHYHNVGVLHSLALQVVHSLLQPAMRDLLQVGGSGCVC